MRLDDAVASVISLDLIDVALLRNANTRDGGKIAAIAVQVIATDYRIRRNIIRCRNGVACVGTFHGVSIGAGRSRQRSIRSPCAQRIWSRRGISVLSRAAARRQIRKIFGEFGGEVERRVEQRLLSSENAVVAFHILGPIGVAQPLNHQRVAELLG